MKLAGGIWGNQPTTAAESQHAAIGKRRSSWQEHGQETAGESLQRQLRIQPFTGHPRNLLSLMLSFSVPLIHNTNFWGSSLIWTNFIPSFTLVCYLLCFICLTILISSRWLVSVARSVLYLTLCFVFTCSVKSRTESVWQLGDDTSSTSSLSSILQPWAPSCAAFPSVRFQIHVYQIHECQLWSASSSTAWMQRFTGLHVYTDTNGGVQLWASHPAPKVVPCVLGGCRGGKVMAQGHHP